MAYYYEYQFDALPAHLKSDLAKTIGRSKYLAFAEVQSNLDFYLMHGLILLLCSSLLLLTASADFGNPLKDELWSARAILAWYVLLFAGIFYCVHASWKRISLSRRFGFLPGRYLFQSSFLDARQKKVMIIDLKLFKNVSLGETQFLGLHNKSQLALELQEDQHLLINIPGRKLGKLVFEKFQAMHAAAQKAIQERNLPALQKFDPFLELKRNQFSGALEQRQASFFAISIHFLRKLHLPLLFIACAFAALFWYARNMMADDKAAMTAQRMNTETAYLAYLSHGKNHVKEMQEKLPRIVFNALKKNTSVTQLRALKQRFPGSDIIADLDKEIHHHYLLALENFRALNASADPGLIATMEQLLLYAEKKNDPNVVIRFGRPTPAELVQLDDLLRKKEVRTKNLKIIPASPHFTNDTAATRESRIVAGIHTSFGAIFPQDILKFAANGAAKPPFPMLKINYKIAPSGKVYTQRKQENLALSEQDIYIGLIMNFNANISIPGQENEWKFNLEVTPPDNFNVKYEYSLDAIDHHPSDSQVYAVMAERAFDQLAGQINATFFHNQGSAYTKKSRQVR
ncbi:hypothetical protein [Undibacterium sp. Tian12W]|uniref:hypothetical protein n=1 Tax=Undibacterium sp. Tian12W TaxID=3413054 RepID=UPI003BF259B3